MKKNQAVLLTVVVPFISMAATVPPLSRSWQESTWRNVMNRVHTGLLGIVLFFALAPTVSASTWYVNGISGNNADGCKSPTTACKTIGHAITLAASGDSIMVAPATYTELLTISISLTVIGSRAATTIVDGGGVSAVLTISDTAKVNLSGLTIRAIL